MAETSPTSVYSVSAACAIDGAEYSVSSFSIELGINSMPFVVLSLGGSVENAGSARSISPADMFASMSEISKSQYKPVCSFAAAVTRLSGGTPSRIVLNKWVLGGVGLTDLAGSGKLAVQVTFMHPACRLVSALVTKIPAMRSLSDFYSGTSGTDNTRGMLNGATNMVHAFDLAFQAWNDLQRSDAVVPEGSDLNELLVLNEDIQQEFSTLIDYTGLTGFPVERTGSQVGLAMLGMFNNLGVSTNLWNFMLSGVLPTTGIIIQPTYDKPGLKAIPNNVWEYSSSGLAFTPAQIGRASLQPMDMSPLRGVLIHTNQIVQGDSAYYTVQGESGVKSETLNDFCKIVDPDLDYGAIESIEMPWWLAYTEADPSQVDKSAVYIGKDTATAKTDDGSGHNQSMESFNAFGGPIAAAYIYERYKQGTAFSLLTPVMMTNKNVAVYPGQRMGISGTDLSFYVNEVKHVVDVAGRQAYSNWTGTHVRLGPDGVEDQFFPDKHPYYQG